jgi:4-amino-4-deoxy-L-arabinose transferase-like glycosyltransferase
VLLAVALLVRLAALWAAADARPVLDERLYLLRAEALLDGEGFVGSYQSWVRHPGIRSMAALPQYPGSYQPPGYTLFVAGALALGGKSALAVKLAQVLIGLLTVGLVVSIGTHVLDRRRALIAGWICALYPTLIAFTHYFWSETLFILLLLAALRMLLREEGPPSTRSALLAGGLLGLAALTRSSLVYFLPLLLAWLLWHQRQDWRRALQRSAILMLTLLAVVAPWSLRSSLLHGGFVFLDTSGPFNLWRGNAPDTFAARPAPPRLSYAPPFGGLPLLPVGPQDPRAFVDAVQAELQEDRPTDLQIARTGAALARREILASPGRFLRRAWTKSVDLWNPTSFLMRQLRLGAYGEVPPWLEGLLSWSAVLAYLLLLALAAVGAATSYRERYTTLSLLFLLFTATAGVVAFGLTRFRLPLVPLLSLLAADALQSMIVRLRER